MSLSLSSYLYFTVHSFTVPVPYVVPTYLGTVALTLEAILTVLYLYEYGTGLVSNRLYHMSRSAMMS
jgi:hypothetical protein